MAAAMLLIFLMSLDMPLWSFASFERSGLFLCPNGSAVSIAKKMPIRLCALMRYKVAIASLNPHMLSMSAKLQQFTLRTLILHECFRT